MVRVLLLSFLLVFLLSINSFAENDIFEIFTVDNSGLASSFITCIAIDENGAKWFGHDGGAGISVFDGNTWKILQPGIQLCPKYLRVADILFDGIYVWAATSCGLYRYDGLSWDVVPETEKFSVMRLLKGPDGALWIGGKLTPSYWRMTVSRLKDGELTTWFVDGFAGGMVFDHDGRLWVGGTGALYCYDGLTWTMYKSDSFQYIKKIIVNNDGILWFVPFDDYILSYNSQVWSKYHLYEYDMIFNENSTVWGIYDDYLTVVDSSEVRRYDLDKLNEDFFFNHIAFDTDGTLWLTGDWPGSCVAHISLNNLNPPEQRIALEDAIQTFDVTTTPQPSGGSYNPEDPFPLSVGNTWVYRREFRPYDGYLEPIFEDRTVLTIIDTVTVNDIFYYLFLDGHLQRKDESGNIYEISFCNGLRFDFTPCSESTCENGIYNYSSPFAPPLSYATRTETEVSVGTETFNGFSFGFLDWHGGESFKTATGIGTTTWRQVSDSGYIDNLYLEYACINGVEIGSTTVDVTEKAPVPFDLSVPYPNPFNFQTTIEFILPEQTPVQLAIYSITGQKVRTLISDNLPQGRHAIRWDGTNTQGTTVASGIYLVRLSAFGKAITRPMAFIK